MVVSRAVHSRSRPFPVFWSAVALLVVAGVAALAITAPDDTRRAMDELAKQVPAFAEVAIDGAPLPEWSGAGDDAAVGRTVPTIGGTTFEQVRTSLAPTDGTARVYVVLAHWCPHCQAEVPRIVDWAASNDLPAGVEVVAVSTAVSESRPNFPPAGWLAREGWTFDVLIDDEVGSAASALGVEGFPFLVFADRNGTVTHRFSGEMPIDEFAEELGRVASAPAA